MTRKNITIKKDEGLDAKPIALLVQQASFYDSQIYIEVENKHINAKSIMGMMSLRLTGGETITVAAEGSDEEKAVAGIEKFFADL